VGHAERAQASHHARAWRDAGVEALADRRKPVLDDKARDVLLSAIRQTRH